MVGLLLGTFSFFWLHTLLWFYREYQERQKLASICIRDVGCCAWGFMYLLRFRCVADTASILGTILNL